MVQNCCDSSLTLKGHGSIHHLRFNLHHNDPPSPGINAAKVGYKAIYCNHLT